MTHPAWIVKILLVQNHVDIRFRPRPSDDTKKGCPGRDSLLKAFMPERSGHLEQNDIGPFVRGSERVQREGGHHQTIGFALLVIHWT